jgi:hypothetical protein
MVGWVGWRVESIMCVCVCGSQRVVAGDGRVMVLEGRGEPGGLV